MSDRMTEREWRLLDALVAMVQQYLPERNGYFDTECMAAGELAVDVLEEFGLIEENGEYRAVKWNNDALMSFATRRKRDLARGSS